MSSETFQIHEVIKGEHFHNILLDVTYPSVAGQHPVVIFSHGFKGFKDWGPFNQIANIFARAGFVFVKFNFSHNGTTIDQPMNFANLDAFGHNNFSKELDDLGTVISWVADFSKKINADPENISLTGHSRGGGITILKAAEDDRVSKIATWAAVSDFSRFLSNQDIARWKETGVHYVENTRTGQMMPLYLQLYFDFIHNQPRLNIKSALSRLEIPVLVVHGTEDETVPLEQSEELFNQNPTNTTLLHIFGADHTFGAGHPFEQEDLPLSFKEVVDATIKFFRQNHR